jgi:hypothetical protein
MLARHLSRVDVKDNSHILVYFQTNYVSCKTLAFIKKLIYFENKLHCHFSSKQILILQQSLDLRTKTHVATLPDLTL